MGISINPPPPPTHHRTHKAYLLSNYILLGASSACVFLTLSLRLIPSAYGLLLIFLHLLTIIGAVAGCAAPSSGSARWHAAHMVATTLMAIFQGATALLVSQGTDDFLGALKSYVREDDGALILKMVGGLGAAIFCMEWMVLALAFRVRYYAYLDAGSGRVQQQEDGKVWHCPFQV